MSIEADARSSATNDASFAMRVPTGSRHVRFRLDGAQE
jgi:hypothetical protein